MILEKETFKEFGYYPSDLKPKSNKKILAACDDCGKVRVIAKADYRALCQTCARKGDKQPNWRGGKVKRICETCGKEFEVYPSRAGNSRGRFCSRSCANKGENGTNWQGGLVKRICETCGIQFEVKHSKIKEGHGRFCSHSCANKGENSSAWKGGISFEPYCEKFDEPFKEYIREKFGRICFLCSKTEAENGQRLSVHHVNYNKDCGCDGDLTCQFVPLCRSCNTKVNFNREMWEAKINNMMRNKLNGWYI